MSYEKIFDLEELKTEEEKINVLIAESENLLRKNLSAILSKNDKFNVLTAKDGLEVIEILKEHDIDLIIMNCILPKVNGYDLISLIRKAEQKEMEKFTKDQCDTFCETEIIKNIVHYIYIITLIDDSPATNKFVEISLNNGTDDFIIKPFDVEILTGKIQSAVRIIKLQRAIKQAYSKIQQLSVMDILCNIYNRRAILTQLKKQLCLSIRERRSLAVIILDLDHFKRINDTYGHQYGDYVLKKVAETLKTQCCRSYDEIGRYGGEEFLIVIPIYSNSDKTINVKEGKEKRIQIVKSIAERILKIIRTMEFKQSDNNNEEQSAKITASLGITIADFTVSKSTAEAQDTELPSCNDKQYIENLTEKLIKEADKALYVAKDRGRDTFVCYSEIADSSETKE